MARRRPNERYIVLAGTYPEDMIIEAICYSMPQVNKVRRQVAADTNRPYDMRQ